MDVTDWYRQYKAFQLASTDLFLIAEHCKRLKYKPLLSLLTPVFNTEESQLRQCLDSVLAQVYSNWELCICDNACNEYTSKILHEYTEKDSRIKLVRLDVNQGGFGGTNAALDIASGAYIGFLDSDDIISAHALYLIAEQLNNHPDANWIYTDEAIIDEHGNCLSPFFKPEYAPDTFYSQFYMSHLSMYRSEIIKKLRLRESAGSHDYDLALRVTEIIDPKTIYHIPVLAYEYRRHSGSVASNTESYCIQGAMKSLQEHLARINRPATVLPDWPHYRVKYQMESYPHVNICMASINRRGMLFTAIKQLLSKTDYPNYSIVLCIPNSVQELVTKKFAAFVENGKIQFAVRSDTVEFNYSVLANSMNDAASGPILCFYNDDVEPLNGNWLTEMVSLAVHSDTGAVGAKLLYPDLSIQHVGCVLGAEESAAHSFKKMAGYHEGYFGRHKLIHNCSMVTGACLVIRKEVYEQVGGYDPEFKVAYGDVDLCVKIQQAGYYNVLNPYATLIHLEAATRGVDNTPEKHQRFLFEKQLLNDRWRHVLYSDPMYNLNFSLGTPNFDVTVPKDSRYIKPWRE